MTDSSSPKFYALLIGIDYYFPNRLPDGASYRHLKGSVRDVNAVEALLKEKLNLPEEQIYKLTASHGDDPEKPAELPSQWPTYENMVSHWQALIDQAQSQDIVYVQYCGHGGRAQTIYPSLKGGGGIDEALVPLDIGNSTSRYLRDLELVKLVQALVDKGAILTLVLDCCHSGEPTRGGDAEVRGLQTGSIDTTQRPKQSLVADELELIQTWEAIAPNNRRKGTAIAGMLPEVKDYVVLAACRPSEYAYEYGFHGKERHGALTYWLLDTLKQRTAQLTYKVLYDRIYAKVKGQFRMQTPMLLGEGDRLVFGADFTPTEYAVTVLKVELGEDNQPKQVLLDVGQAQGLAKGAAFAIYPLDMTDFSRTEQRLAIAELTQRGATQSWAEITTLLRHDIPITAGDRAVLTGVPLSFVKKVRWLGEESSAFSNAISGNGWVEAVGEDEAADYQVARVGEEYQICDRAGVSFPLKPTLAVADPQTPTVLVERLVHLAKYQTVQELENHDPSSPLRGQISVKFLGKQLDYEPGDLPRPQPFADPNQPEAQVGECVFLEIQNNYTEVLNVVVLNLQLDWAIDQIYPASAGNRFVPIDPGDKETIPIYLSLPSGNHEGTDIFKVFATLDAANFRWLELPPLNQPISSPISRGFAVPANPLEELFAAVAAEQPPTRKGSTVAYPSREWTTTQVSIRVRNLPSST